VDTGSQTLASIQHTSTLQCQGTSTPLYSSGENSGGSSHGVPSRKCRVRVVDIHDLADDEPQLSKYAGCLSVTTLVVPVICIMQSMCSAVSSLYADVIEQRPISLDVTSVDTVTQWREDWSSASVVSHTVVTY